MTAPAADKTANTFDSLNLHPKLLSALEALDFSEPTPIQRDSIPPALKGRDVLACAATGSGKTAAFLLPILQRLLSRPSRGVTRALVLTPTRELAAQIVEHFEKLAVNTRLTAAAVYGGVGMAPQEKAFRDGVDVIVACPGRLLDHFKNPYARLSGLDVLVLDEVDRMLDMGFLPDVRRVLKHIPKDYEQALFFSATLPKQITELARRLLKNPVTLSVERRSEPAKGVKQTFWPVLEEQKRLLLLELLKRHQLHDVLVFTRTKHRANRLADYLVKQGVSADRIHGNRSQAQRTRSLANFKSGKVQVLVATDIAARGIDVSELSHVVNFDVPHMPEDYIHRVGRTARAGATGDALTFITPLDDMDVRAIEHAVGRRIDRVKLDDFDYTEVPKEKLEIELRDRLAKHRAQRQKAKQRKASSNQEGGKGRGSRRGKGQGGKNQGGRSPEERSQGGRNRSRDADSRDSSREASSNEGSRNSRRRRRGPKNNAGAANDGRNGGGQNSGAQKGRDNQRSGNNQHGNNQRGASQGASKGTSQQRPASPRGGASKQSSEGSAPSVSRSRRRRRRSHRGNQATT